MRIPCGCYIDAKGKRYATCPTHNGNGYRDDEAKRAKWTEETRRRAEARKTYKASEHYMTGRTRPHGVVAE